MNRSFPTITIDLVLNRNIAKDVMRAVLHSILFHRLFGTVKEQIFEILDVTMPGVDDPEIKRIVDEKVDAFWKGVEGGTTKHGQITVTLSEKRARKSWFSTGEEEVPWEQWNVTAEIRQPISDRERQKFDLDLASALTKSLKLMLDYASSEQGRAAVPPITNAIGISPFPVKMTVKIGGVEIA
ncbi:DUF1649-domain-containing protein [Wolfiporia cocos MD-104 SS10]|uniref:Autophagy-related protein 101 n=1 Tax=Wolfiporia cocos (strain MD-104) TaxID=742152 RepID=A0A2H3JEG1_WOLCO|nr:DUF1649-domain-containing protein [Wolfiporia cocos MD-104 SS10]